MTCKNCLGDMFCSKQDKKKRVDKYCADADEVCKYFKDKSRFFEFPCRVGEMVHYITFWGNEYDYHCIANASFDVLCQLLHQKETGYVVFITDSKSKAISKLKELKEN